MADLGIDVVKPFMEFGWQGLAFLLLAIIVWQFRVQIQALRDNTRVIQDNTEGFTKYVSGCDECRTKIDNLDHVVREAIGRR